MSKFMGINSLLFKLILMPETFSKSIKTTFIFLILIGSQDEKSKVSSAYWSDSTPWYQLLQQTLEMIFLNSLFKHTSQHITYNMTEEGGGAEGPLI
jgi:hypothetical protein